MAQTPNRSVQAVFFDVGNTLVSVYPSVGEVYSRVAGTHGVRLPADGIQKSFDSVWREMASQVPAGANRYRRHPGGEMGWWQEVISKTFAGSGYAPEEHFAEFFDTFASAAAWRKYPEVEQALGDLSSAGLKLGVISNWDSRLPALLDAVGLRRYFSVILYSAAEDVEKPAPEIFQRAAQRCGVEPDCALHVGDRLEEDYKGAKRAGLQALLLVRNGGATPDGAEVVRDLNQVVRQL